VCSEAGHVLPVEDIAEVVPQTGLPAQVLPSVDLKLQAKNIQFANNIVSLSKTMGMSY
jgi:hypothetical protein